MNKENCTLKLVDEIILFFKLTQTKVILISTGVVENSVNLEIFIWSE